MSDGTSSGCTPLEILRCLQRQVDVAGIGGVDLATAGLGADPSTREVLADLVAVGITRTAWRDGPVEDWHASPDSRISDGEMMRTNAAMTRLIREVLRTWLPAAWWDWDAHKGLRTSAVMLWSMISRELTQPALALPDGRTVGELASTAQDFHNYVDHIRRCGARWWTLTALLGLRTVLGILACEAGWLCRRWWLTPTWPLLVEELLRRSCTGSLTTGAVLPQGVGKVGHHADVLDVAGLRGLLLSCPDRLDPSLAAWCTRALSWIGLPDAGIENSPRRPRFLELLDPDIPLRVNAARPLARGRP